MQFKPEINKEENQFPDTQALEAGDIEKTKQNRKCQHSCFLLTACIGTSH